MNRPSRRGFLATGAAVAGALLVGVEPARGAGARATFAPNAFIRIDPANRVTLIIPQEEMGQGVYTALSQLLADELDASLAQVAVEAAPPNDALYGGPKSHMQSTGGSTSIRNFYTGLRQAGANARAMLVQAAASQWKVDPAACRTADGEVLHDASGRRLTYGTLAARANAIKLAGNAPLKDAKALRLIGRPVKRLDAPDKVTGRAEYGIDVMAGRIRVATLAQSPTVGGKVRHVDPAPALALPGVRQVVVLDDVVAVVGDHMWAAQKGLAALAIDWAPGANGAIGSAEIWGQLRRESARKGVIANSVGDADSALGQGSRIDAVYEMPLLAHATMEPLNVVVHCSPGKCELWTGTQVQTRAQKAAAAAAGLQPEQVVLNNHMLGGGFGRRLDTDMITVAVRIAKQVKGPVKIVWSREEDMRHDVYRPAYRNVMAGSVRDGRIQGWTHRIAAASVSLRMSGKPLVGGLDKGSVDGATELVYDIPNQRVEYVHVEPRAVNVGYWRGVGPNNCVFAIESLVDELAHAAGKDPVAFRLAMMGKSPRAAGVLRLAAAKAGWGSPLGHRVGRGVCVQNVFGSYVAAVCEVEVDDHGDVRVRRYVAAVDCGLVVNPDTVVAQIQGGLIFGLTAALHGDITVRNGRVQQGNFNDYRMLRIHEAPAIDVHLVRSDAPPGGIGEPGVSASTPSLVNAIAAATGIRLRRLPIDRDILAGRKRA